MYLLSSELLACEKANERTIIPVMPPRAGLIDRE
jgi:hypothetical protein